MTQSIRQTAFVFAAMMPALVGQQVHAQVRAAVALPPAALEECRNALAGNGSWIIQRGNGAVVQMFALRGANDFDPAKHTQGMGAVIGAMRELGNADAEMEKGKDGWTIPRGGAVCVVALRASPGDKRGKAHVYLLDAGGNASKPLGSSDLEFMPDEHHDEAYACWTGEPQDKGCPDRHTYEQLITELTGKGFKGAQLDAAMAEAWAVKVELGPWFSCAKNGCCRI